MKFAITKKRLFVLAAVPLTLLLIGTTTARTAQKPDAVRIVPNGRSAAGTPGQKGATYYALEGQATKVTTEFIDGNISVAERSLDGDVVSTLRAPSGLEINRLRVNHKGGGADDAVQYFRPGVDAMQALLEANTRPTLDWSNRQSYRLYQDNVTSSANLRWRGGFIRANGSSGGNDADDEAQTVKTLETLWANGLSASTRRVALGPGDRFDGKPVTGSVLVTTVRNRGVNVGVANYFVNERIYAWKMPGATEGLISTAELTPRHGGWLFTPDMAWMNLQALAFFEWSRSRPAAARAAAAAPKPGLLQRMAGLLSPTLHASAPRNEPGCDDLHWLDGSVYRFCCDIHDLCYEKYGCEASSWWQVWTSWRCDRCNAEAVWCFAGGGTGHGPYYI